MSFELANPWALWLLAAVPLLAAWSWWPTRHVRPALRVPTAAAGRGPVGLRARTRFVPVLLRLLVLAIVAVAIARPRGSEVSQSITADGIDIVIALDTSGSMLAEDMAAGGKRTTRLEAAKTVAADFIGRRPTDRIGLVSFDDVAVPRCPPTLDHGVLLDFLSRVEISDVSARTAIGTALAAGINRLGGSSAKSRVIILVTDGRSNAGRIEPLDAAELARAFDVKVHSIGIGSREPINSPVRDAFGRTSYRTIVADIDEDTLKAVSKVTGGAYFRAANRGELEAIFDLLDRMETTEIEVEEHVTHREFFPWLARSGALLLGLALVGGMLAWRTFP